jgi:hypothetical protein
VMKPWSDLDQKHRFYLSGRIEAIGVKIFR